MEFNISTELPSHSNPELIAAKDIPVLVSETAAKLALQSTIDNPDSRTGRQLKKFSVQLTKKLAKNEYKKSLAQKQTVDSNTVMELSDRNYALATNKDKEIPIKQLIVKEDSQGSLLDESGNILSPPLRMEQDNPIESLNWDQLMVEVRSLVFTYKRNTKFMDNLDMSVPKSAIYGLLGPSGCGKTTLLKLILGLMRAQSGTIKVNGKRPGDPNNNIPGAGVGFMPQDLALYQEFTLNEALRYFGKIYGMPDQQILMRTKFLANFLDLPDPDRLISHMSGGQKRRVSLSLSLVHNPPLLILDEPTVGTDPVLRERIWEHLLILSRNEATTIIITTHYIEEARRAHVISLMRRGQLLVEHSPKYLLNQLNAPNLEEVFLKCCNDNPERVPEIPKNYYETRNTIITDNNNRNNNTEITDKNKSINRSDVETGRVSTYTKIINQTNKNYIRLIRNKPLLVFETVLPTFCIIVFFLCIGTKPFGIKIAVYNEEFLDTHIKNNTTPILSLEFLSSINNKTIEIHTSNSAQSAINSVTDTSDIYGALVFHKDFSTCFLQRLMFRGSVTDYMIENSTILFYADFTDMILAEAITRALVEAEYTFLRTVTKKFLEVKIDNSSVVLQDNIFDPIVKFVDPPVYGSIDPQFRDFITPGIILAVIYAMSMGLTALSLVVDRKDGTMERTMVAGVKQYEILASQVILQFFIVTIQTALLLIFTFVVFRAPNRGGFGLVIGIILLQGVTGMCYGLLISSLSSDENTAIMAALGSFYPFFLLSGIIWPLEGMPYGLRMFTYILPQTLPITALRNVMLKGWSIDRTFVFLGFISTTTWMFLFLILADIALRLRSNPYLQYIFNK